MRRVSIRMHGVYEIYACIRLRDEGTADAPPLRERAVSKNPHLQGLHLVLIVLVYINADSML
jgi:hypothetical protein